MLNIIITYIGRNMVFKIVQCGKQNYRKNMGQTKLWNNNTDSCDVFSKKKKTYVK